jgi:NAD(P)-dependent dehydrogenase (short-subunit alcohol dehydrogenase family)
MPRVGRLDTPVRSGSTVLAVTFCGARPRGCCDGSQPESKYAGFIVASTYSRFGGKHEYCAGDRNEHWNWIGDRRDACPRRSHRHRDDAQSGSAGELQKLVAAEKLPVTLAALNVDDDASVDSALGKVLAEHGRLDVLVNNAGVGGGGSVEESSTARFREVMETNFFGALRCIKAVVRGMRERRQGCIVNVTSLSGRLALAPAAAYCASKFALEALSECLAQEMKAFNVRVAIIEPGVIATPIFSKAKPIPEGSPYPQARRQRALFAKSLTNPTSPYVVGEKIREILDGNSWQLVIRSARTRSRSSNGGRTKPTMRSLISWRGLMRILLPWPKKSLVSTSRCNGARIRMPLTRCVRQARANLAQLRHADGFRARRGKVDLEVESRDFSCWPVADTLAAGSDVRLQG